jgi:hypothetical protein
MKPILPSWCLDTLFNAIALYPRISTDREIAEKQSLEWVTPGHPLFEALRRHMLTRAHEAFLTGASFYSLEHVVPARVDFYRAKVVDGIGRVAHEQLFAVELREGGEPQLRDPNVLGNLTPAPASTTLPSLAHMPEALTLLHEKVLTPFLDKVRTERTSEVERIKRLSRVRSVRWLRSNCCVWCFPTS